MSFSGFSISVIQIGIGLFLILSFSIFYSNRWGAPWVTTPHKKIDRMLELVELQPGEKLIDLGSGDGRILIAAAKKFHAQTLGVEIDPIRVLLSRVFIARYQLGDSAKVVWGNMFKQDISDADVITVFLTRSTNKRLKQHFENRLKPGTRIASFSFPVSNWTPIILDDTNLIFVYQIGKTGGEVNTKFV